MNLATRMSVVVGDITQLQVDAIVNAANQRMLGGGGVDGAIHRAAGSELFDACKAVPEVSPGVRCPTGQARLTPGFDLPAGHIIHTVGPVYAGGKQNEPALLADAYRSSLQLAADHGCRTLAFPCISTGVYGYPKKEAARIAFTTTRDWLNAHDLPRHVTFCCFSDDDATHYTDLLA